MSSIEQNPVFDEAIGQARAGEMTAGDFASAFAQAEVLVAITEQAGEGEALPLVVEADGTAYGVAFTTSARFDAFATQFAADAAIGQVKVDGASLGATWPGELGLAINPESEASLFISASQFSALLESLAGPAVQGSISAGTELEITAPEVGLGADLIEVLVGQVRQSPQVAAVYQLDISQGGAAPQLVIGVEPAVEGELVAQAFAGAVGGSTQALATVPFADLRGPLLQIAQERATRLA